MDMPDFSDVIKFLNSEWGTPKTLQMRPKWDKEEHSVGEVDGKYIETHIGSLYYPEFKATLQLITTVTTVSELNGTTTTTYNDKLAWVKDNI